MYLTKLKATSGENLPTLVILEKEFDKSAKQCWGCPFTTFGREPDPLSVTPKILKQCCQFVGFRKFSLFLCTRCNKSLENGRLSDLDSTFEFSRFEDGQISPVAPESIDIHIHHISGMLHIRCYKLQTS